MDIQTFINNYYEAFSLKAELPIAFWYSDSLLGELKQTQGCLFKALPAIRQGEIIRYLHFARIDRLTSFEKVEAFVPRNPGYLVRVNYLDLFRQQ